MGKEQKTQNHTGYSLPKYALRMRKAMKLNFKYQNGLYFPEIELPEQKTQYVMHKYGGMRYKYLLESRKDLYLKLFMSGDLNEHLHNIELASHRMVFQLTYKMKKEQGVNEQLKKDDRTEWNRRMDAIKKAVDEIILQEIICV